MDDKLDEAEFWLPSEFLTDEDIIMDHKKSSTSPGIRFPYDYGSSALSSPVESLVGSTETESSDEEDFLLTGLTRQLSLGDAPKFIPTQQNQEKVNVLSGSPQSTLTKVGSWSGRSSGSSNGSPNGPSQVSSPPTTPLGVENDPWDLIYQAAGQIARLKMNGGENPPRNPGILGPPKRLPTPPPLQNTSASCFFEPQAMRQDACGMWSREVKNGWRGDSQEILQNMGGRIGVGIGGNGMGPSPCVWSSQQRNPHFGGDFGVKGRANVGAGAGYGYGFGFGSGCGVGGVSGGLKRERSGTGVFLPRRYENNNFNSKASEYRKKPVSPVVLPNKPGQSRNQCFDSGLNGNFPVRPNLMNNGVSLGDYEASLARRNALIAQQRRNLCPEPTAISQDICLPQEWTY